jgi:undecaprenyl-diphosphatase
LSILESILLGIVQGVSEFLPISSTGHVTLVGKLLNLVPQDHPESWTAFIAVIQLGTMAAVLVYFAKDIIKIVSDFVKENLFERKKFSAQNINSRLGWLVIIGTIPVVIFGLLLEDIIEGSLTKNLYVISFSLIGLALVLAFGEKFSRLKKEMNDISVKDSILIGFAQAFALIPGSSRSGTTITGGLFLGLKRDVAARFSFLLSIPAVFASGLFELIDSLDYLSVTMMTNLAVATIVSGISGYLAIDFLLKFLKKHTTFLFVYYRIAIGVFILILLFTNTIQP